jgi:hypothetical protein
MTNEELFHYRIKLVDDAVALTEPERVPVAPMVSCLPYFLSGEATFRDSMYNYPKAAKSIIDFYVKISLMPSTSTVCKAARRMS